MSLSSALNNAASGLAASARAVQVASANVANAMTDGYAPRRIDLSAVSLSGGGGGVRVSGVTRQVDPILLGHVRDAGATEQASSRTADFWQRIESALGLPDAGLGAALSDFDAALIAASERPDLDSSLSTVVARAKDLVQNFGAVEDTVQSLRSDADAAIARDVATLNDGLRRIDDMNAKIVQLRAAGRETLALEDERQALISTLSEIVPMREYGRSDGRVTLFSAGGAVLLDLDPQEVGFTQSPIVDASMQIGNGLSGLTLGGRTIDPGPDGPLGGGRLGANFALRDVIAPEVQVRIDTLAADLVARFQDPQTDPTLASGSAGLFTDAGAALSATPAAGLAGRLALNAAVDPSSGGALWRLRDGLGATTPGPVGDATQIANLLSALDRRVPSAPGTPALSLSATLAELGSTISTRRQDAEADATLAAARLDTLTEETLAQGVDTDAEMQRLLQIEQAYAANARVIETADAMLRRLLEI
ncbi:MAG: flagellar hook-associated protein FlgK [Pararhodobacter sp.]